MDKRIIKKLVWFIGSFLVLNFILNFAYLRVMAISRLDRVSEQLSSANDPIKYLVLGDSHSQRDFDTSVLDHSFNFSSVGENFIQSYYKLKTLIDKKEKKIESIIMPMDFHTFSSYRSDDFRDSYYWVNYIDYLELGLEKSELSTFALLYVKGRVFPYSDGGKKNIFDFISRGMELDEMHLGFVGYEGDFSRRKNSTQLATERVDYHLKGQNALEPVSVEYYSKLLKLCRDNNIRVYMVKCPITMEYYLHAISLVDQGNYYDRLERIAAEYDNVHVLDFQKIFFEQNHYFYDPDHLNKAGAYAFSTQLGLSLVALETTGDERKSLVNNRLKE